MKKVYLAIASILVVAACDNSNLAPTSPSADRGLVGRPEPPMLGAHWARGEHPARRPSRSPAAMTWHNGDIMVSSNTYAIFWGPSWGTDAGFTGDKIDGISAFLRGFGGSKYAAASTEYTGSNGKVGIASSFGGAYVDNIAAPRNAPQVSDVESEVCKVLTANSITPQTNAIYNVYATTPRGSAGYCAWHSYGSCGGVNVQFAWYFNLDGDSGCNPGTPYGSYAAGHNNSQGLAAIANVTAHEVSETITDPRNGGWYDSSNGENADKCAWAFSTNNGGLVALASNSNFRLQMEWSNAAYNASSGFSNTSGQKACLDGN